MGRGDGDRRPAASPCVITSRGACRDTRILLRPPRGLAEELEAKDPLPLPETTHRLAQSALEELDALLEGMRFDVRTPPLEEGEFWSLGGTYFHRDLRPIHVGFVEPVLRLPIIEPLSERVVGFLLQIPGDKDLLKREHHDHFG